MYIVMVSRVQIAIYLGKSWDLLHKATDACDICKAVKMKCHKLAWETKQNKQNRKRYAILHLDYPWGAGGQTAK